MNILIVKMSSLGDIIQTFPVLHYLHSKFPGVVIDWAVEASLAEIVTAHPLVNKTIALDMRGFKTTWNVRKILREIALLREHSYDVVFDLQKNTKSGLITLASRSSKKVGFTLKNVREWPNVLATNQRLNVSLRNTVRSEYLELVQTFFGDNLLEEQGEIRLTMQPHDKERFASILANPLVQREKRIMVCIGSKWKNKQLPLITWISFLEKISRPLECVFLLVAGNEEQRVDCEIIHQKFLGHSLVLDKLSLPLWQNLMNEMALVIGVDSAALHLCGTTRAKSFSVFGPTISSIFKPVGKNHFALQGSCPYKRSFVKQCPILRTCATGACIRDTSPEALFDAFWTWWIMG